MNRLAPPSHSAAPPPRPACVRHFAQDQPIYREGGRAGNLMQVVAGMVRSVTVLRDGRRYIEAFYLSGDVFGFEDGTHYTKSAEAVSACAAVDYPVRDAAPQANPAPSPPHLARLMQQELQLARDHARLLSRASARQKTAMFLLECSRRSGDWPLVTLAMTRQDIGDYLGLAIETVSRSLAQLHRENLIEILSARHIRLVDIPALRDTAS